LAQAPFPDDDRLSGSSAVTPLATPRAVLLRVIGVNRRGKDPTRRSIGRRRAAGDADRRASAGIAGRRDLIREQKVPANGSAGA
jgi:hypothetical protein